MQTEATSEARARFASGRARPFVVWGIGVLGAVLVVVLIALTTPNFLTPANTLSVVRAAAITGIMALGMTFITISGNYFSLAMEQTAAFCGVVFAMALTAGMGLVLAVLVTLLLGIVIGAAQGVTVAVGANPIIT